MKFQKLENQYLVQTYIRRGLTMVKGQGVYLYDSQGRKYLDFMSNIGVNIFGHSHPVFNKTLISQSKRLVNLHGSFANDQRAQAAEKLVKITPNNLKRVYFCNSGTEAIEAAIKFSFLATGRKEFIVAKEGYHGKTLGALSLMGNQEYRKNFNVLLSQDIEFIEYNSLQSLKQKIDKNTAALFLEPIQGEAGIIPASKIFLEVARKLCNKNGAVLVFDEIQSGMGRTGKFLACQHFGVSPDILCLAKGLGGGIPLGVTLVSEKIHQKIPRKIHTSTFGGNPLATTTCLSTLNLINQQMLNHVEKMGKYFLKKLKSIKSEKIKQVRGMGLMIGVELNQNMTPVVKKMQSLGVLAIPTKNKIIRFLPPLIVEKKHIEVCVRVLEKSLKEI